MQLHDVIMMLPDVTHVSLLKSHVPGRGFIPPPPQLTDDGQAELRSSASCDTRTGAIEKAELVVVYVLWKDYERSHDTWDPEAHFTSCPNKLKEYRARIPPSPVT